jgi:hypothetical protein
MFLKLSSECNTNFLATLIFYQFLTPMGIQLSPTLAALRQVQASDLTPAQRWDPRPNNHLLQPLDMGSIGCWSSRKGLCKERFIGKWPRLTWVRSSFKIVFFKAGTSSPSPQTVRCVRGAEVKQPSSDFTLSSFVLSRNCTDRTQTGHVLGNPHSRAVAVASDRQLSPVVFILIRLLTHLTMLSGAAQNRQVCDMPLPSSVFSCYRKNLLWFFTLSFSSVSPSHIDCGGSMMSLVL